MPRLRAYGETVDDHQLESARRFAEAGLVHLVEDPRQLGDAMTANGDDAYETFATPGEEPQLVGELRDYLRLTIDERQGRR